MVDVVEPWHLRWTNFRGYDRTPLLEFPAMTLLIGRNNAGKTSAYAPLLLLRQTLEARNPSTALLFRGELVDFGTYGDVVTDHDEQRDLSMRLDLGDIAPWYHSSDGGAVPHTLEVTFKHSDEHPAVLKRSSILDQDDKVLVSRTLQPDGTYKVASPLLPNNKEVGRPIKEVSALRKALQSETPTGFLFSGISGIRLPADWRRDQDRWLKVQGWYRASSDLFDMYSMVNNHVTSSLLDISYIGPLRSAPQRSYLMSPEPPADVGRDGQWTSEVLYRSSSSDLDILGRANSWLQRLGYGTLSFESMGSDYFRVLVQKDNSSLRINLADCGVGLSQLLPLLVQGCVMAPGDTLIAQQPEIHLNPAQQDVVTDFLIDLAQRGRRVLVETHSEHVLTRLRRRIAEGEGLRHEDVALYFSESAENRSTLRRIDIGELGEVSNEQWPEGFFGEQLHNSLKLALAQSRRRAKKTAAA